MRLVSLILVTILVCFLFTNGWIESDHARILFRIGAFSFKSAYILYCIGIIACFFLITILMSLLSIYKVEVNTTADTITFTALLNRQTIAVHDISQYFETNHRNGLRSFSGLIIRLNNDRKIQVSGQNTQQLQGLKDYLNEKNSNYAGQRKMSFPFN